MANLRREKFDRERSFFVVKPSMTFDGKSFVHGDDFDKSLVGDRRLRQLYDTRFLGMRPVGTNLDDKPKPIILEKLSLKQLTLLLEDNGVTPRVGATRKQLEARARKMCKELEIPVADPIEE